MCWLVCLIAKYLEKLSTDAITSGVIANHSKEMLTIAQRTHDKIFEGDQDDCLDPGIF